MLQYLIISKLVIKQTHQANHHRHISRKSDTSSRRAPGRSFRSVPEEDPAIIGHNSSMHVIGPEHSPVKWDVQVEDSDIGDPDLV